MCAQDVNSCENTAYRLVDIFSSSLLHLADDFLCRWIDRRECFARDGINELIVDEQLRLQFGNLNKSHDEFVSLICLFVLIRCQDFSKILVVLGLQNSGGGGLVPL